MSTIKHLFSVFDVTRQVFFNTPLSLAIVNLKPLVPGRMSALTPRRGISADLQDVLVLPQRVVPRLTDLRSDEVTDLFLAVQRVGRAIGKAYRADALTISLQDGIAAGQSVPHVHVHILPRSTTGPFSENKDDMYPALEIAEESLRGDMQDRHEASPAGFRAPKDEDRKPRSEKEMQDEAEWLKTFF